LIDFFVVWVKSAPADANRLWIAIHFSDTDRPPTLAKAANYRKSSRSYSSKDADCRVWLVCGGVG